MQDILLRSATHVRSFLIPVWTSWQAARAIQPPVLSANTCVRTSVFLSRALKAEGLDACWINNIPRTSDHDPDLGPFGFLVDGRWESHAWVECNGYIVDITADQFGAPPVIVTSLGDPRYGRSGVDLAAPEYKAAREAAVETLWPQWVNYRATSSR